MSDVGFFYSEKFLRHETGNHPENKERLTAILKAAERDELKGRMRFLSPPAATKEQIALVHDEAYIQSVENACAGGGSHLDLDTVISPDSYVAALEAAGAVIASVDHILDGKINRSFCAVRPPGHHAERDRAMGFCLFNNIAIGAEYAVQRRGLKKIFIFDWDVHHGNGTQHSFYRRGDIYYSSIHQWPHYPGTGAAEERGEGEGFGTTLNFPLSPRQGDETYLAILEESLIPEIVRFSPDLIMISAGFDAHQLDFLAGMEVTTHGFAQMTQRLVDVSEKVCQGRLISVLEGGYHLKGLGDSVAAHLSELLPL